MTPYLSMRTSIHNKQSGLALPLALILLLVMTMLGVSSLRMATMDENMTSNNRLQEIAFNASETTLHFAEQEFITSGIDMRTKVFDNSLTPSINNEPGDSCTNGYCIVSKFHTAIPPANGERWTDPTLDVWADPNKHLTYGNYSSSGLENEGVHVAPKYIIEFLGNVYDVITSSNCYALVGGNDTITTPDWPYCPDDPQLIRITALASAGSPEKNARVMLQSTIQVDN